MDYIQLLMISWVIRAKNSDQNAKKWKRPPKSSKNKMFIFGLRSTSDDWPSDLSKKHQTKMQKKQKRPPKSLKNQMFIFGLHSTSDDLSDPSKKHDQNAKKWKRPPKSLKNKMFIFGLHSTSDDRPSNLSKKCWKMLKNEKGPLSHRKIKCSFLDYVQLLMISQAIWAKSIGRNAKKRKRPPKSLKNKMFIFGLRSTSDDRPSNQARPNHSKKCWLKCKKTKKAP